MALRKHYAILFMLMAAIALLITACSQTVTGSNPGASSLTPLQVLQKSVDAMKQLKSSHIELQSNTSLQTSNTATPSTGAGTPAPSNVNINITGTGDEAFTSDQASPDQEQLTLNIGQAAKVAEIVQNDKIYVQNPQGQWFVLNKSDFQGSISNPFSGVNLDQNSLLGLLEHTKITDHGDENLNGQSLRHITADLDKTALRQMLNDNPQLQGALGQQNLDAVMNNLKSFQSSIDVWIDETQFYVHRTELKLNLVVNTSTNEGAAPSTATTNLDTIIDLSKFNQPVTITPPTNATPTNNPGAIFGFGRP
ncbi:MAG TPA: DUF6612 family protein [Ktedonosporobacter sp.]|jgi:hypothetical protein|nr:DUF6612 family protein [Ktedonosporobacter sp.]